MKRIEMCGGAEGGKKIKKRTGLLQLGRNVNFYYIKFLCFKENYLVTQSEMPILN